MKVFQKRTNKNILQQLCTSRNNKQFRFSTSVITENHDRPHTLHPGQTEINTKFEKPIEDFEFNDQDFASRALDLAKNRSQLSKLALELDNQTRLQQLHDKINVQDPFSLVQDDLEKTRQFALNNILKTEYKVLQDASNYNLNLKGKNFRSALLFTLAKAIYYEQNKLPNVSQDNDVVPPFDDKLVLYNQVMTLAACIEIAHNASLLQDDIIDKAGSRRSKLAAYKVFGPENCVFASDYMISRASRMLAMTFETAHMSQLFSTVLNNLVYGELIQAKRDMQASEMPSFSTEHYFESYISKTYYKTASMISIGCRGLGLIFNLDQKAQRQLFDFGAHLGIAFQIHDDILDFTQDSAQLGKPAFNDLKEGIVTAPMIYGMLEGQDRNMEWSEKCQQAVLDKFQGENDVQLGMKVLKETSGIEIADQLSIDHIDFALQNLSNLKHEDGVTNVLPELSSECEQNMRHLIGLVLKIKTRKY